MASKALLVVAALTVLAWPDRMAAQGVKVTVLSIGDGDTIRVRQAGKALTVRLACIDAPETAQSPYGQQARSYLQQRLAIGREVSLDIKTTDRYGRSVAELFSGVNINLAMVEDGQAFAYRQYLSRCKARGALTSLAIATAMGKPANPCAGWGSGGTGIGPSASHHQRPEGVL